MHAWRGLDPKRIASVARAVRVAAARGPAPKDERAPPAPAGRAGAPASVKTPGAHAPSSR